VNFAKIFRYGTYLLLIVLLRVQLYRHTPLLLTADSFDYIGATTTIGHRLDFSSNAACGLRDWRVPGYPVFQAIFLPLTRLQSDRILLLQTVLGLAGVVVGWLIGRALGSALAAEALMVFLGVNPLYLFYEHWFMSEGLSLVTVLGFALTASRCFRDGPSPRRGVLIGALCGACTLVRINSLPFCATVTLGLLVVGAHRPPDVVGSRRWRPTAAFALAIGLAFTAVVGPWILRNYGMYRRLSINVNTNRNLLIYYSLHLGINKQLPELSRANAELSDDLLSYEWLQKLTTHYGVIGAEDVAGRVLSEQRAGREAEIVQEMLRSFLRFGGHYTALENDLAMMRYWFDHHIGRAYSVKKLHDRWKPLVTDLGLTYATRGTNSPWTRSWRNAGRAYLIQGRPLLFLGFFGALCFNVLSRKDRPLNVQDAAIRWFAAGYLAVALFHATTLTESDRFASLYDWVAFLVVLLVAGRLLHRHPCSVPTATTALGREKGTF